MYQRYHSDAIISACSLPTYFNQSILLFNVRICVEVGLEVEEALK